jgi:phosphoribosylaminoimidazole-succinocarboxamide synthase
MNQALSFPRLTGTYHGKVRDTYNIGEDLLVAVVSDRISAFDVILPQPIPFKGQVLNQLAAHFLDAVADIVPTWKLATPHPSVTVGLRCTPIRIEMVIRGYLTGHAWRTYQSGARTLCGVTLPEGMRENDPFPEPIITPATKAEAGHDEDISREEILRRGLVSEALYTQMEQVTRKLFARGTEMAAARNLILVDTKYEFGLHDDHLMLIDELHTPDSSRYFHAEGYSDRQASGIPQQQLSKEFVREWLMAQGFRGLAGQTTPQLPPDFVQTVSERYIDLFEKLTGRAFIPHRSDHPQQEIEAAVSAYLEQR